MKIVKLSGGLGNQMFQYAFGLALKQAGNETLFDNSWFDKINTSKKSRATKRNYELDVFKAEVPFASPKQIKDLKRETFFGLKLPGFIRNKISRVIRENSAGSYYEEFLSSGDAYYAGVFGNSCYFDAYRRELLHAFSLKDVMPEPNQAVLQEIKNTNSVSLHIRRGDYVKLGWVCNLDYYYQAINYITSRVEDAHFYIFSDDMNWVKENLKIEPSHTFVDINSGSTSYCDLELMKNCRHNITANSTFSWWAAYLNPNPHKIVLAPKDIQEGRFRLLFKGGYC